MTGSSTETPGRTAAMDRAKLDGVELEYDRLARIKAAHDPDNVFRVNQNIAPRA